MPLTWQNVAGPNFGDSNQSFALASQLFDRAMSGAQSGLQQVDQRLSENVNNAFQTELLKYQDAAALEAALAQDPTLGIRGGKRIDSTSRALAGNQVNTLLDRNLTRQDIRQAEFDYDEGVWQLDEEKGKIARLEAAAPQISAFIRAGIAQDPAAFAAAGADLEKSGLRIDEILSAYSSGQDLFGGQVDISGNLQNQNILGVEFRDSQEDRKALIDGERLAQVISETSATVDGARDLLINPNVDARTRAVAARILEPRFPGLLGLVGGPAANGAGPGSANALNIMNYEARASGFNFVPETVKTVGDARNFALEVNEANRQRTGRAGSSAMGLYQITGTTMESYAKRLWGNDWRNKEWSASTQDEIARAIFEDNNGSAEALRKQWVSLSLSEAEQIRRLPWEEARVTIARKESNGNPADFLGSPSMDVLQNSAAVSNANDENTFNANSFAQRLGRNPPPLDVARALIESGNFAEGSERQIAGMIRDIVARGTLPDGTKKISTADAADIIARAQNGQGDSYRPNEGFWDGLFSLKSENESAFESRVDAEINQYLNDDKLRSANTQADRNTAVRNIAQLNEQVQAAAAELTRVTSRSRNPLEIARATAAYQQAVVNYNNAANSEQTRLSPKRGQELPQVIGRGPRPGFNEILSDIMNGELFRVRRGE